MLCEARNEAIKFYHHYSLMMSEEKNKATKGTELKILTPKQCNIKMDTIFMISENSKNSETHVLVLKLSNKLDLRIGEKVIALSNLSIYYTWKNIKSSHNNNKFKNISSNIE